MPGWKNDLARQPAYIKSTNQYNAWIIQECNELPTLIIEDKKENVVFNSDNDDWVLSDIVAEIAPNWEQLHLGSSGNYPEDTELADWIYSRLPDEYTIQD